LRAKENVVSTEPWLVVVGIISFVALIMLLAKTGKGGG
jgi:hypothetical protein